MNAILCSFSGAVMDLKRGHRSEAEILAVLAVHPRVSVWDMSETKWLRDAIARLEKSGDLVCENEKESFPWCRYRVVETVRTF